MSLTTATATAAEQKNISVWFECKSCQFTFPFRTVAEFLDHKKQKHFAEFQKAQCIVFEERLQDQLFNNSSGQNSDTKLFAQDDDVEFCPGIGTREILTEIAKPSSLKPLPLALRESVPVTVHKQVHKDDVEIQTTGASALQEKLRQESEFNYDFGLFSICLPSVPTSTVGSFCDLQADLILNDSSTQTTVKANHLAHIIVDVENNSAIISSDHFSEDFSFDECPEDNMDVPVEVDVPSNVENSNNRNLTSPNPYVPLHRLSTKELILASASSRSYNFKNTLKSGKNLKSKPTPRLTKVDTLDGPFACTICSKSCKTKAALGGHIKTHSEFKRTPRRFKCSSPDCSSSFDRKYLLKHHTERHESVLNKVSFKFPLPDRDTGITEADPLTLREWLIQQKLSSKKSNNFSKRTNTVNLIRLDPDPTEMDETTDKAFKISGKTPIKCKLCNRNLESEAEVKVHVMHCWLRNKKRHCYCVPCDKAFSSPRVLKSHREAIHAEQINMPAKREYKCHICLRPFNDRYNLNRHLLTHKTKEEREREASFVCEICGKAYIFKQQLVRHIVAHGEDRPFKCSYPNCSATFKFNRILQYHLETHLPNPQNFQKLICCPEEGCPKRFMTKAKLRGHLRTMRHTGVSLSNSWKCDQENCDKLYRLKASWNRHRIVAHGVGGELPTFQCQICNKTFTWKISLIRHLRFHTGERPFKCSYDGCEKAYVEKESLDQHLRGKHTGERPFQCELCGKAYHRRMGLKWHMGVHRKSHKETL